MGYTLEQRIQVLEAKLDIMRKRANRSERAMAQYEHALEKMDYPEAIAILKKVQG